MKMKIKDIKIGKRIREDIGDLSSLQKSIETYGLLNPIIVNQNNELIAGFRRLTSCKNLGLEEIDVNIVSTTNDFEKLEIESHENFMRKDFTEHELEKIIEKKKKLIQGGFWGSVKNFFKSIGSFFAKLFGSTEKS